MQPKTAERLRSAAASGAYSEVEALLDAYRQEVEASWKSAGTLGERRAISIEVTGLLQWVRHTILAKRSHTQSRLIHLTRRNAYATCGTRKPAHLQLDA
jgi:hypothetical protein